MNVMTLIVMLGVGGGVGVGVGGGVGVGVGVGVAGPKVRTGASLIPLPDVQPAIAALRNSAIQSDRRFTSAPPRRSSRRRRKCCSARSPLPPRIRRRTRA